MNAYRPKNISSLLNNCRHSNIFFAIRIPSFPSRGEFDAFTASFSTYFARDLECFVLVTFWRDCGSFKKKFGIVPLSTADLAKTSAVSSGTATKNDCGA